MSGRISKSDPGREGGWIECEALGRLGWLVHGFSTRNGGKKAGRAGQRAKRASTGEWRPSASLGAGDFVSASLRQTHSSLIYSVEPGPRPATLRYDLSGYAPAVWDGNEPAPFGDALVTNHPGILLSVRVADCMPVLLVDPENRAVAGVHAGWRGALSRIVEKTAGEMRRIFHSRPEKLIAAIGPSIRNCCYEVGEEVFDAFSGTFERPESFFRRMAPASDALDRRIPLFFTQAPPGHGQEEHSGIYLDLVAVARYQLESAGVPPARIHVADYCTACRPDLFYSYRKQGSFAGRMTAAIGIRPGVQD